MAISRTTEKYREGIAEWASTKQILRVLSDAAGIPLSRSAIASATQRPVQSVSTHLYHMRLAGLIERSADGFVLARHGNRSDVPAVSIRVEPVKALVIGGEESFVRGVVAKNLERVGIEAAWIWPYQKERLVERRPIPTDCEAVILLTDMMGHTTFNMFAGLAKQRGLPCVRTTRKWSFMLNDLRESGLIRRLPTEAALVPMTPEPGEEPEPPPEVGHEIEAELAAMEPEEEDVNANLTLMQKSPSNTPPPAQTAVQTAPSPRTRTELVKDLKSIVGELITGHHACNFKITDEGKISFEIRVVEKIDVDVME